MGIRLKKGERETERVPFPCIVKACRGGSSVGVCIAHDEAEYEGAKSEAFLYDDEAVIEQYIEGREYAGQSICLKAINFFLFVHHKVHPRVIFHAECRKNFLRRGIPRWTVWCWIPAK